MGFPLVGDLGRFESVAGKDEPDAGREGRRALVGEFRQAYPGVLEAREHAVRRIVDPFGLWMFAKKAKPGDLVVVHTKMGEGREAVAIVEVMGPYFFAERSPWPHRLPVAALDLGRWEMPSPYSGWGNLFGESADDNLLPAIVKTRVGGRPPGIDAD
jgi:hypothetical protein